MSTLLYVLSSPSAAILEGARLALKRRSIRVSVALYVAISAAVWLTLGCCIVRLMWVHR